MKYLLYINRRLIIREFYNITVDNRHFRLHKNKNKELFILPEVQIELFFSCLGWGRGGWRLVVKAFVVQGDVLSTIVVQIVPFSFVQLYCRSFSICGFWLFNILPLWFLQTFLWTNQNKSRYPHWPLFSHLCRKRGCKLSEEI